jgi:hypothetical protein
MECTIAVIAGWLTDNKGSRRAGPEAPLLHLLLAIGIVSVLWWQITGRVFYRGLRNYQERTPRSEQEYVAEKHVF